MLSYEAETPESAMQEATGWLAVSPAINTEVFWTCPRCVMVLLCRSFATFIRCTADMFQLRPGSGAGGRRREDSNPAGEDRGRNAPAKGSLWLWFRVTRCYRTREMLILS